MKALFKKPIAVILAALLLLTAFPLTATAATTAERSVGASSGTTGKCKWTLDNGTLTISGNGAMANYASNSTLPWGKNITNVVIENGVTTIGSYAFYYCTGLTSVTIGNSVTTIGSCVFYGCTGLTSVTIGNSVTSIGGFAFKDCTGLTSLTIGNNVTSIGKSAFYGCKGLTSVTIPDSVTSIGSGAFYNCTGLTSVTIPDSVTSIGESAFYGCTGLKSITIPDSVTSIEWHAFYKCTGLESVIIGNSVTSIGYTAFYGCTGLTSVTIPDSVTSIGNYAFSNTAWYNNQPDGLVYAGKVAYKYKGTMPNNTSIDIKDGTKSITGYAFKDCTGLTGITIPDSVTSIGNHAFYGCTRLTSVTIPDSVTSIGDYAFEYCTGLTSVTIPDSVTSIGDDAFCECTGLKSVTIPDSVTSIGDDAFYNTAWYKSQPNGLVYAGKVAYKYKGTMPNNTSIDIKDGTKSITDYAFKDCTGPTSVTIPDSVTSIGEKAFYNCYNLTIYGLTGSTAESYADNFGINFVSLDDMPTEPTTAEPTTAEPTTEQPDDPQGTDVTIKLAAPVSTFASRYTWNDAVFYYGDTSNFDDLTKVSMTDTGEKFYTTGTFNSTIITPGAWKIYSVTLTAEQIQAVDASKFAGFATSDNVNRTKLAKNANVFSAATGEYANYSSAASGAGGFDGKTFVFANASYGSTSPISYMGYWINSYVTVKAAAPMANTSYSRWDSMQLYYGNTAALADMETVDLFNTKETTKVTNSGDMTIKNGRWYIYAITLTDTQANAVDSAAYVGFKKAGAENRTSIMMNVLKAKTNSFDGTYGAKRTLNDLEGQVFVISGQTKTGISVATYVGQWKTRDVYTAGDNEEITIYFAVPKAVKAVDSWDTGVEFYYSNENSYKDAARMQMTPEPDYDIYSDFSGQTFEQGSCSVYSLTIPAVKVREIDECKKVGFVKKGSYNRTYYAQGYAVTRASTVGDNQSYGLPQSIEAFDGNIFVITGCTDPNNERVTYTGWWN